MVESLLVKVPCSAPLDIYSYSYNWKILQLPKPQRCTYRSLIHDDEVQVISNRTKPEAVMATCVSSSQVVAYSQELRVRYLFLGVGIPPWSRGSECWWSHHFTVLTHLFVKDTSPNCRVANTSRSWESEATKPPQVFQPKMSHQLAWQVDDIAVNVLDQIIHHGVLHSQISSYHIVNNLSESFNSHHTTYLVCNEMHINIKRT